MQPNYKNEQATTGKSLIKAGVEHKRPNIKENIPHDSAVMKSKIQKKKKIKAVEVRQEVSHGQGGEVASDTAGSGLLGCHSFSCWLSMGELFVIALQALYLRRIALM